MHCVSGLSLSTAVWMCAAVGRTLVNSWPCYHGGLIPNTILATSQLPGMIIKQLLGCIAAHLNSGTLWHAGTEIQQHNFVAALLLCCLTDYWSMRCP